MKYVTRTALIILTLCCFNATPIWATGMIELGSSVAGMLADGSSVVSMAKNSFNKLRKKAPSFKSKFRAKRQISAGVPARPNATIPPKASNPQPLWEQLQQLKPSTQEAMEYIETLADMYQGISRQKRYKDPIRISSGKPASHVIHISVPISIQG